MITRVVELDDTVFEYLKSRGILKQYEKAKQYILAGRMGLVQFKKRKPLKEEEYEFRITQKYRAICYFRGSILVVVAIDDHQ